MIYDYRIRAKGNNKAQRKWVIERRAMGSQKWISRTLLPLSKTWDAVCPDTKSKDVSDLIAVPSETDNEKFAQSLLNESEKSDTEPSKADILKSLEELGI